MRSFEHPLQGCQLIAVERGSIASLLSSSFAVLVILIVIFIATWRKEKIQCQEYGTLIHHILVDISYLKDFVKKRMNFIVYIYILNIDYVI